MDMNFKACPIDQILPLLAIRNDMIVSKRGDITVGWELDLPASYSVTETEYDEIIGSLHSAVGMMPSWTILHKQDFFSETKYVADTGKKSFLGASYERHFDGRKYLSHNSRLFLTFSKKANVMSNSSSSSIFGGLVGKSVPDAERISECSSLADRFISVVGNCRSIGVRRLSSEELTGVSGHRGMIEEYLMLGTGSDNLLSDLEMAPNKLKVGGVELTGFVISELESLPGEISSVSRIKSMSTSRSNVFLSTGAAFGVSLACPHVLNQYLITVPQDKIIKELESKRKKMSSMSKVSSVNMVNAENIGSYIEEANRNSTITVYSHINILAWSESGISEKIKDSISAALSSVGIAGTAVKYNLPCLYIAGIPGGESEIPTEQYMTLDLDAALCLWSYESFDYGLSGGSLKLCDRIRMIPMEMDIQEKARDAGYISNFNGFVLGPSGSGKSFMTNKLLRDSYDAGAHIFLMDVGDSYEGLCAVIREESGGKDGIYYSYDPERPFSFNPFLDHRSWGEEDNEGKTFLTSLIRCIWSPSQGWSPSASAALNETISRFIAWWDESEKVADPILNDYADYIIREVIPAIEKGEFRCVGIPVTLQTLDINDMMIAMSPYIGSGKFSYLLNSRDNHDIFESRFTVFEVDKVSKISEIYKLWLLCIMHSFEDKMRRTDAFKLMVIEEAWKAIMDDNMAPYIAWLWRTARKFRTSAVVVTQQVDDIIQNSIIRDAIVQNSSVKILMDQSSSKNNFSETADMLALNEKDMSLVLSVNKDLCLGRKYKEVFISLGNKHSGVYAVEVSPEEAIAYESEKPKKEPLMKIAKECGSFIKAIEIIKNKKV